MSCSCDNGSRYFSQDPDENLDYTVNWASNGWLVNDVIVDSAWEADAELTLGLDYNSSVACLVWVQLTEEAVLGETYTLTNKIRTQTGRMADQSLLITAEQK